MEKLKTKLKAHLEITEMSLRPSVCIPPTQVITVQFYFFCVEAMTSERPIFYIFICQSVRTDGRIISKHPF